MPLGAWLKRGSSLSELGELLELLYRARDSFRSYRATVRRWRHEGRNAEASLKHRTGEHGFAGSNGFTPQPGRAGVKLPDVAPAPRLSAL